jgi:plasmid maintenance system antidote protein VapI
MVRKRKPTHPGEILEEDYIRPLNLQTNYDLWIEERRATHIKPILKNGTLLPKGKIFRLQLPITDPL